jgi:hypothetical protein
MIVLHWIKYTHTHIYIYIYIYIVCSVAAPENPSRGAASGVAAQGNINES